MPGMSEPKATAPRSVPGVVLAAAILLGLGGSLALLGAVLRGAWSSGATWLALGSGGLYVALAYYLYRGNRWAWLVTLVLCGIGLGLGLLQIASGVRNGLVTAAASVLYAVLLTVPPARKFFVRAR
jgi:hypothetical protein